MNQAQLIHSAKQRDPAAITALLNQSLNPRRIEIIETLVEENLLILKLQSRNIPNQHKLMPFLAKELDSLGIESIERVMVYGLTAESTTAAWEESLTLTADYSIVNHVTKIDILTLPEEETPEDDPEAAGEVPETAAGDEENATEASQDSPDNPEAEEEEEEEEERSIPSRYALPTTPDETIPDPYAEFKAWVSSSSSMPILIALSIGFGVGMMGGMYLGYQKAVSDFPAPTPTIEQPQ